MRVTKNGKEPNMEQTITQKKSKTKRRITCGKCRKYSRQLGRCIDGQVNPRTRKSTIEMAEMMGPSYVCVHNPWILDHLERKLTEIIERVKN